VNRRWTADLDLLLALAIGVEMQIELTLLDAPGGDVLAARGLALVMTVALALRRRLPVVAVGLVVLAVDGLEFVDPAVSDNLVGTFFVVLIVAYSLGANRDGRALAAGTALLCAGGIAGTLLDAEPVAVDDILFVAAIMVVGPLVLGRVVRARGELAAALREKSAAGERERGARAAAAVTSERERLAAELDDHISAALTTMVARAAAAEQLACAAPDGAEQAFAAIEATGRDALAEIRIVLGVLRREGDEPTLAPQPSLAHLGDLVERVRSAGVDVRLEVSGEPPPLPAGVDLTAYRFVQEALGDAGERATVRLRYGAEELVIEVRDERGNDARLPLGLQERVALYGGELVMTPHPPAGRTMRARLPLEGAA
jgi:signal transduction histidine kinase